MCHDTQNERIFILKKHNTNTYIQLSLFPEEDEEMEEKPIEETKYDHTELFARLAKSDFRSKFHLKQKDIDYINAKGLDTIRKHAEDFVSKRLAPASVPNDGRQTPMRGHPVFVAQHATACCCRGCFEKWHHIPKGRQLTNEEQQYAVSVLMTWIEKEYKSAHQNI